MAKKDDDRIERLPDGTAAVPVTADDPEVTANSTDLENATPSDVGGSSKVKDSDPLPAVDESAYPERPYAEAVTPEHRDFLARAGITIERPDGK